MARIQDSDIAAVRERAHVDDVIREVVALKSAGGGSYKGLCPFHDERTPSFHVTPSKGFWHCFGCQEGGDVIDFVRKIDQLTFAEAVEKLAGRVGITLRYEEGGAAPNRQQGERTRLVEAHRLAAAFYSENLASPDAQAGRDFLTERGFTLADAEHFGVGFAPAGWDGLTGRLRSAGFADQEILTSGLAVAGKRGPYDRFRGRLVWPIREASGDVIGFGARRVLPDDDGPKYLNTPETPIYRKSQLLYGVDLARKSIARQRQAVVVEGYTDVMAVHLSGIETAVATCGTAFGADHVRILRRLLMDQDEARGEVIFTFDGDAAGQRAALKAFDLDQRFVTQTFVAIEPDGLDPCDLRRLRGAEAVRDLVARRVPLFEFAIRSTLAGFQLDSAEGRVGALKAVAPMIATIRDASLRPEYARLVAGWLGMETTAVTSAVRTAGKRAVTPSPGSAGDRGKAESANPVARIEREVLKCALQVPQHSAAWYDAVEEPAFRSPDHLEVYRAIAAAGGPSTAVDGRQWVERVIAAAGDDLVRTRVRAFAVDPLPVSGESDESLRAYCAGIIARLLEIDATRRISEVKARLQRMDPTRESDYGPLFADLLALEEYRRGLREQAVGVG
ncbi:MAG: DNA primase [Candidatus Nanopelagicales bacterium]|nr:DNA primase [Candidatus Nanopelagicales bacterium]